MTLTFYLSAYWPIWYYTMQRSLNDFFVKNRNETVKRKHDSNSDDDSAVPNNNVIKTRGSGEPVSLTWHK